MVVAANQIINPKYLDLARSKLCAAIKEHTGWKDDKLSVGEATAILKTANWCKSAVYATTLLEICLNPAAPAHFSVRQAVLRNHHNPVEKLITWMVHMEPFGKPSITWFGTGEYISCSTNARSYTTPWYIPRCRWDQRSRCSGAHDRGL
jgi:hypothetical protein